MIYWAARCLRPAEVQSKSITTVGKVPYYEVLKEESWRVEKEAERGERGRGGAIRTRA